MRAPDATAAAALAQCELVIAVIGARDSATPAVGTTAAAHAAFGLVRRRARRLAGGDLLERDVEVLGELGVVVVGEREERAGRE